MHFFTFNLIYIQIVKLILPFIFVIILNNPYLFNLAIFKIFRLSL